METVLAGRYFLIKPLGGGGFGQTFLATDRYLPGQPICVVKQFKPRSNFGDSLRAAKRLFDLEAETLYRLGNHDQIPRLLAHFEEAGEFYLVQEWIEGESLQQELETQGRLDPSAGIALLQDLLEVLAFVHQENVIHRDIKPSNLIHRQADRCFVLIDFGAVKQVTIQPGQQSINGQPELTVAVGSPGYMPPEQLSSRPHFSSDLYALGIVVLQAMSGIPAIELPRDPETGEICCAMLGDRLLLPPDLAQFIDILVRYDYRDRYPTAVHALNALRKIDLAIDRGAGSSEYLNATLSHQAHSSKRSYPEATLRQPSQDLIPTVRQSNQSETLPPLADPSFVQRLPPIPSFPPMNPALPQPHPDLSSQEYRNRQALLNKVKNFWVKGVLETSLHDQVSIVLGLEARSDAVSAPWNVTIAANEPLRYFPQGTQIGSLFAQMGTGRSLLILGEPGAGKTTTLLQLARDLIARAEQDVAQLIPVVLNLSSWTGSPQTIAQWVVEELNLKYQVPKRVGQAWVEHQQLLLLLDGLDEVRSTQRDACVIAINQFQQAYSTELVVCSRIRDYEALSHRLKVQIAVAVRSLTPEQVQSYLDSLSTDLSGLKQLLQTDEAFRELAQSPLLLNMMVLAYQGVMLTDLPKPEVLAKRRSQVFDAYIVRMFQRQGTAQLYPKQHQLYSEQQTIGWLSWLAQQMMRHSQTIVLIERIQRSWLHTSKQRLLYTLISAFTISTVLGLMYGIATAVSFGIADGLRIGLFTWAASTLLQAIVVWFVVDIERLPNTPQQVARQNIAYSIGTGVILGISIGMIAAIDRGFALGGALGFMSGAIGGVVDWFTGSRFTQSALGLTETLKWSWKRIQTQLWFWLPVGIVTGLGFHGLGLLSPSLGNNLLSGAITGTVAAIATGLDASSEIETKTKPNQGIWQSAKNFLLIACLTTPTLVLSALLLSVPLYIALIFSWLISLNLGGSACVVHLSLRLTFWLDRRMPWNTAHFLNYATQLTFLQKVGGGYLFVHRLLMEHFAQKTLPPKD